MKPRIESIDRCEDLRDKLSEMEKRRESVYSGDRKATKKEEKDQSERRDIECYLLTTGGDPAAGEGIELRNPRGCTLRHDSPAGEVRRV